MLVTYEQSKQHEDPYEMQSKIHVTEPLTVKKKTAHDQINAHNLNCRI